MGFLDASSSSGIAGLLAAFWQEMGKHGWIESKNIDLDYRFAEHKFERLPELAAELVRLQPDLIVVAGTPSALAVKNVTTTIPVVITNTGNPVAAGLIVSLARPGGNLTGLVSLGPELNTKRLEILKDTVHKLAGVALLWPSGGGVGAELQLKELRPAALSLQLRLEKIETQLDPKSLANAFRIAKQKQVGALMTITSRPFFAEKKRIVELAGQYKFPAIYFQTEFVDEGGLMSYGVHYDDLYRRSAVYVDKILNGAKPADLPVQQATKFEFVVNLNAAKQICLTIPANVLERANKVIKY